jgi:hypothetical protein
MACRCGDGVLRRSLNQFSAHIQPTSVVNPHQVATILRAVRPLSQLCTPHSWLTG